MEALLHKIGLSKGEIRVYSALLDLGSVPLNTIHERVGFERRNIYDILNKLIERGFVTYVKENRRRIFRAADPTRIIGYLDERSEEIENIKAEAEEKLPQLVSQFSAHRIPVNAEIFRGGEGVKSVWVDMLNAKEIWWLGSGGYMPRRFPHFFYSWNRRRIKKKVRQRHLYREDFKHDVPKMGAFVSLRFLPKEFSANPVVVCVWGDKVGSFIFSENLFVFVIESKELAENYKEYHRYLWDHVATK